MFIILGSIFFQVFTFVIIITETTQVFVCVTISFYSFTLFEPHKNANLLKKFQYIILFCIFRLIYFVRCKLS